MLDNLFQPMHLLVILFIALLVFGPKKLPELGKGLGEGIRSFKDSMNAKDERGHQARGSEEAVIAGRCPPDRQLGCHSPCLTFSSFCCWPW